ncbi:5-formyltetrahydrofolate cyclo-ligase [Dokdonia sp. Hel_I_53]|uniref:5-formyltetrahydrofolate cyclo-ligase n=1 Tax=Dokdonia sp. Hel_I_53 TaxID=1566287 RepID=UPI0011A29987|nr:5-formyltetrahydrofolate cyclo-ligase [Dokdonia sp. Hel_I_53]
MSKQELRKKYKALRTTVSKDTLEEMSLQIANKALQSDLWDHEYYHVFLPIEHLFEINTEYLLSILSGKDKHILLSKSNFDEGSMQHFLLTDSSILQVNPYGIPEPKDGIEIQPDKIDVVFIPLLAYDKLGNRVGYGKGFYDRFLASCNPEVIKVGMSLFEPEVEPIEANSYDVALDYCITPRNVHKF